MRQSDETKGQSLCLIAAPSSCEQGLSPIKVPNHLS